MIVTGWNNGRIIKLVQAMVLSSVLLTVTNISGENGSFLASVYKDSPGLDFRKDWIFLPKIDLKETLNLLSSGRTLQDTLSENKFTRELKRT